MKNRNFVKLLDFTPEEIRILLNLSADLKKTKYAGTEQPRWEWISVRLRQKRHKSRGPLLPDHKKIMRNIWLGTLRLSAVPDSDQTKSTINNLLNYTYPFFIIHD